MLQKIRPGVRLVCGVDPMRAYWRRALLTGQVGYWPLWEKSGTVAQCLTDPAMNGAYNSDVSGWPPGEGIGDGNTAPLWTTGKLCSINTAAFRAAFNGQEGTIFAWVRMASAGTWTDGLRREAICIHVDANNYILMGKSNFNNNVSFFHNAGGTFLNVVSGGLSTLDWVPMAMTWSKTANEFKAYWNGAQTGTTQTGLGTWAGTPFNNWIGYSVTGTAWDGWLAHGMMWDWALPLSMIQALSTP